MKSLPDDDPTDTQAAALLLHLSSGIPVEPKEDEEMANLWEFLEPSDPVAAEIHTPTKQLQSQQQRCDTPKSTKKRTRRRLI